MTKYLSHYHLCLMVKEYLLHETQDKVYASVVFIPLLHSVSNTLMIMTYSIISLLNISSVNRTCIKKTISMNKGSKVGMMLFGDVVYCQTWNVIHKIAQKCYIILLV
jgi:hypothetical protein